MLRKFSVENYRSFNKKVTLDLTNVRNYAYNLNCVDDGILSTSMIIGKNGCGKTNFGLALFDIVCTLTDRGVDLYQKDINSFLNGFSKKKFATFIYEFQSPVGIILYEYRKTTPDTIVYESMYLNDELIFVRNGMHGINDYSGLKEYSAGGLNVTLPNGPLSLLRYVVNNTLQSDNSPLKFVMDFASHMLYFRSLENNSYIGISKGSGNIDSYIIQNGLVKDFQRFLNEMADLDLELDALRVEGMQDIFVQRVGNKALFFNDVASSGTKSLRLFYYWMKHFNDVKFLYMDEFDAFYHYELAENILKYVRSIEGMQVILTSHNTSLVSTKLLRPDCYMKLEDGKMSNFPDSTDVELRQGHNLEKMLRGGEFDERS